MDKTVKIKAYPGEAGAVQGNPVEDKHKLELATKDAQIEDERGRALEHLKTIVQLRETLKLEQGKSTELMKKVGELEAKIRAIAGLESGEIAAKNAQLEAEKNKSVEYQKIVEQLRETLKQEQAKSAALSKSIGEQDVAAKQTAELEARVKEIPALEARIQELSALGARASQVPVLEARIQELSALEAKVQGMAALEARVNEIPALEAKVAELKETLGKIAALAANA